MQDFPVFTIFIQLLSMHTAMTLEFTVFNNVNECKKGPFTPQKKIKLAMSASAPKRTIESLGGYSNFFKD